MVNAPWLLLRWKEGEGLPKQPGQSNDGAKTATTRDVERHNLVLRGAVEIIVGAKAQPTRPSKLREACGREYAYKLPGLRIVFADSRDCVERPERTLTRHQHVAVRRDDEIERTELRILDQPNGARVAT
jgi:hypothetical protein